MKKILVSMMGLLLSTGLTYSAFAAKVNDNLTVGASVKVYIGQYDSGVDGENAYLSDYSEMNLRVSGGKGVMSAFAEIEHRNNNNAANAVQYWVKWDPTKALAIKTGTLVNIAPLPYSYIGQFTSANPADMIGPLFTMGYTEDPGIGVYFKATPNLNLEGSYFMVNYLAGGGTSSRSAGKGYQVGAHGSFGGLAYRLYTGSATTDDVNDDDDEALSNSATGGSVQYSTKTWNVSGTYKSRTDQALVAGKADTQDANTLSMLAGGMDLGPGNARLTYMSYNVPDVLTQTGVMVRYNYPAAGGMIQVLYNNVATDNEAAAADDPTATFLGVGFNYNI